MTVRWNKKQHNDNSFSTMFILHSLKQKKIYQKLKIDIEICSQSYKTLFTGINDSLFQSDCYTDSEIIMLCHFVNPSFWHCVILSTNHFADLIICQRMSFVFWHFVNWSFCQPDILKQNYPSFKLIPHNL
jgi:hypothetical protein